MGADVRDGFPTPDQQSVPPSAPPLPIDCLVGLQKRPPCVRNLMCRTTSHTTLLGRVQVENCFRHPQGGSHQASQMGRREVHTHHTPHAHTLQHLGHAAQTNVPKRVDKDGLKKGKIEEAVTGPSHQGAQQEEEGEEGSGSNVFGQQHRIKGWPTSTRGPHTHALKQPSLWPTTRHRQ